MIKNIIYSISLIIGMFTLSFILFNLIPTNPARIILGPSAPEEAVKKLQKELNLDKPLHSQYITELINFLKLKPGKSIILNKPTINETINKLKNSSQLIILSLLIALIISYTLNLIAFYVPKLKPIINLTKLGVILPTFVSSITIAVLLTLTLPELSLRYQPQNISTLILPALILSFYPTALLTHILNNKINEITQSQYFISTLALGFSKNYLFHKILLKSTLVSLISTWTNLLSVAFFSTITIEIIFSIPGIGPLLLQSITQKDFPMLKTILIINAFFFILVNTLTEIIYHKIDPRIK
mgnify:CR=1 FL=1